MLAMENLSFIVDSQRVQFNRAKGTLLTAYDYQTTRVETDASGKLRVKPVTETLTFKTDCKVPRVGCMLVGWGGNNGCTVTAAVLANKLNLEWRTRDGVKVNAERPHLSLRKICGLNNNYPTHHVMIREPTILDL